MFQPRVYRNQAGSDDLVSFRVCVAETDLLVSAESDQAARGFAIVRALREDIEQEIGLDRRFLTSLEPLPTRRACPPVVRAMYEAAQQAGVGPMAAVAGAVAESVARALQPHSAQIVVENGGDIYIISKVSRVIGIQAGQSPLSGKLGLKIPAGSLGVCTSSGTVGHSLSFGRADAALIAADDGALADAFASALGNRVQSAADVPAAMEWAQTAPGVRQALVIVGETMGVWGEFELTAVGPP
ncbi:UPF0280 family protein [bacterium]|nr:UPF0280 family protein [bacterium]